MLRFCRTARTQRFMSTSADATRRSGYGPGFAPPQGSRETPKLVPKRRDVATSLPSHLGPAEAKTRTANSSQQKFREDMRSLRHAYARELLEKHGQRQAAAAMKRADNEERAQSARAVLSKEKEEQKAHEKEVLTILELDAATSSNADTVASDAAARHDRRIANRLAHEENLQNTRRKMLAKLYHSTDSFVTLDNLDEKVDLMVELVRKPYNVSLDDLMISPLSEHKELERRKELLKETLGL